MSIRYTLSPPAHPTSGRPNGAAGATPGNGLRRRHIVEVHWRNAGVITVPGLSKGGVAGTVYYNAVFGTATQVGVVWYTWAESQIASMTGTALAETGSAFPTITAFCEYTIADCSTTDTAPSFVTSSSQNFTIGSSPAGDLGILAATFQSTGIRCNSIAPTQYTEDFDEDVNLSSGMGVFSAHHLAATSGSIGFTNSGTSTRSVAAAISFTEDTTTGGGGGGAPTTTSVDGDDDVTATQVVVVVGTNYGATRSTSKVETLDGATAYEVSNYGSWSDTSLTVTLAHAGRYGASQLRVTVGASNVVHNITINPPSPYTTLTSLGVLAALTFSDRNLPSRIYDVSPDIADNEQVRWYVSGGSGAASIETDGALQVVPGVTQITYSHFNSSTGWSADTVADCRGLFPDFIAPNIPDETLPQNIAITTRAYGAKFEDLDGGTAAYSLIGGAIPGLSLNASTGDYTGTPTTIGTYASRKIRRTDDEGNTADSNAFTYVIGAPPVPPLKLSDISSDSLTVNVVMSTKACGSAFSGATSFARTAGTLPTGLSLNTSTGDITGTPTVAGVYSGIIVTATNAAGSTDSNPFALTVISVIPNAPVFVGFVPDLIQNTGLGSTTLNVSGYFTGTVDSYVASPDVPSGITFNGSTGAFTINLSALVEWAGTVTATNINGSDVTNSFGIRIGVVVVDVLGSLGFAVQSPVSAIVRDSSTVQSIVSLELPLLGILVDAAGNPYAARASS